MAPQVAIVKFDGKWGRGGKGDKTAARIHRNDSKSGERGWQADKPKCEPLFHYIHIDIDIYIYISWYGQNSE